MTDDGGFTPPPPPRATADRTASDLADARLSRRRETRLRIVEAIAPQLAFAMGGEKVADLQTISVGFRKIVDALESIVEPTVKGE